MLPTRPTPEIVRQMRTSQLIEKIAYRAALRMSGDVLAENEVVREWANASSAELTEEEAEEMHQRRREGALPVWLPSRQNFAVQLEHFGDHYYELYNAWRDLKAPPALVRICLEGIREVG